MDKTTLFLKLILASLSKISNIAMLGGGIVLSLIIPSFAILIIIVTFIGLILSVLQDLNNKEFVKTTLHKDEEVQSSDLDSIIKDLERAAIKAKYVLTGSTLRIARKINSFIKETPEQDYLRESIVELLQRVIKLQEQINLGFEYLQAENIDTTALKSLPKIKQDIVTKLSKLVDKHKAINEALESTYDYLVKSKLSMDETISGDETIVLNTLKQLIDDDTDTINIK